MTYSVRPFSPSGCLKGSGQVGALSHSPFYILPVWLNVTCVLVLFCLSFFFFPSIFYIYFCVFVHTSMTLMNRE